MVKFAIIRRKMGISLNNNIYGEKYLAVFPLI